MEKDIGGGIIVDLGSDLNNKADLNDLKESGIYEGGYMLHAPSGCAYSFGSVIVTQCYGGVSQLFMDGTKIWIRDYSYITNLWSNWNEK